MISELGFLSPEVDESETQLMTTYCELFDLSERMSKLFVQLLRDADLDHASPRNMAMNALAAKSLELFQSSVILLRKGCIPAARVLCRALIETIYKLCAIELVSDGIDRYISQEKKLDYRSFKVFKNTSKDTPNLGLPHVLKRKSMRSREKNR